jgi:hypothetical protein
MFLVPTPVGIPIEWRVSRIEFDFEDPAAVPEPSTTARSGPPTEPSVQRI